MSFQDHVRDLDAAVARDDAVAAGNHLFLALHRLTPGIVVDIAARLVAEVMPHFRDGPGWFEGLEEQLCRVDEVARNPDPERYVSRDAWEMPSVRELPTADALFRAAIGDLLDAVDGRGFPETITSAATGSIINALAAREMVVWRGVDPDHRLLNEQYRPQLLGRSQEGLEDPPEVVTERRRGWRGLLARLEDLARQSTPEVNDDPGAQRALARWRNYGGVLYPPPATDR